MQRGSGGLLRSCRPDVRGGHSWRRLGPCSSSLRGRTGLVHGRVRDKIPCRGFGRNRSLRGADGPSDRAGWGRPGSLELGMPAKAQTPVTPLRGYAGRLPARGLRRRLREGPVYYLART